MRIGEEIETYAIEPLENPVPPEEQQEPFEEPAEVEPEPAYVLISSPADGVSTYDAIRRR